MSLDKPFRTGKTAAKKAQKEQSFLIKQQRQKSELDLAESEDEIARKLVTKGKGRMSLIKTSEVGVKSNSLSGAL